MNRNNSDLSSNKNLPNKFTNNNGCDVIHSSQKEISEDVFSQLIFGIEDEFLKEDD